MHVYLYIKKVEQIGMAPGCLFFLSTKVQYYHSYFYYLGKYDGFKPWIMDYIHYSMLTNNYVAIALWVNPLRLYRHKYLYKKLCSYYRIFLSCTIGLSRWHGNTISSPVDNRCDGMS